MTFERSLREAIAILLLVAALMVAMVRVAEDAPLEDWWFPVLLGISGLTVGFFSWLEERRAFAPATVEKSPEQATTQSVTVAQAATPPTPDDLTKIEGIGPKMSQALMAAGVETFAALASASEDDLREAVEAAGMRFAPSLATWAEQADYAAHDDWDGLKRLQDSLKAGRRE